MRQILDEAAAFMRMPPGVKTLVLVMVWPAIWAGFQIAVAFGGDLIRERKGHRLAAATGRAPVRGWDHVWTWLRRDAARHR